MNRLTVTAKFTSCAASAPARNSDRATPRPATSPPGCPEWQN